MKTIQDIVSEAWPGWHLEEQIGAGAFAEVFRAVRDDASGQTEAAVKVVTIRRESLRSLYADEEAVQAEYEHLKIRFSREIRVMQSLKGHTNLVSIDDSRVIDDTESGVCRILIRMELLTPLLVDLDVHGWDEERLIRMGTDLCRGLEVCWDEQIVHRDIKPENIFVNHRGDFKLGDFGTARTLDVTRETLTDREFAQRERFSAPEVHNGQMKEAGFDLLHRADLYSLGMVLYWIANGRRFPFLPDKQLYTSQERDEADRRRLAGEPLPEPAFGSDAFRQVILKACAFSSAQRYQNAAEFRKALENVKSGIVEAPKPKHSAHRNFWYIAASLVLVAALGAVSIFWMNHAKNRTEIAAQTAAVEVHEETPEISTLLFSHILYPREYAIGQPFTYQGIVASDTELKDVTIHLYTETGAFTQAIELPGGTKRLDMKDVSDQVLKNLDEGEYWFEITASDAAGRMIGFSNRCAATYTAEEHIRYEFSRAFSAPELRGSMTHAGHTYEVYRLTGGGWNFSSSFAQGKGGHLATFADEEELNVVGGYCLGLGVKYLNIGAQYVSGKWSWVDGSPFDFHPWKSDALEDDRYQYDIVGCIVYGADQTWRFGKGTQYEMSHFIVEYDEYLH